VQLNYFSSYPKACQKASNFKALSFTLHNECLKTQKGHKTYKTLKQLLKLKTEKASNFQSSSLLEKLQTFHVPTFSTSKLSKLLFIYLKSSQISKKSFPLLFISRTLPKPFSTFPQLFPSPIQKALHPP
jgi:hypothetical protein